MQQQTIYYNPQNEFDEELNIDFKKIFFTIWNKRILLVKVFCSVLAFFILLTFILPKKYKVEADLYVNKSNNTNMSEFNPFIIDEASGSIVSMGMDKAMNNELELIQSPLVIDKVIRENNLVVKKIFGIIPTRKEGEYITTKQFLKKNITFENKKNTNVITIEYKSKKNDLAYDVVNSIIKNYIELHKYLLSEKAKSDIKILEEEYAKAKSQMNNKISNSSGIPATALSGSGNIAAMSAFSTSAQKALSNIQGQYIQGERSRLEVSEDAAKVAQLSSKLEWAKLVADMSDSSKVVVLKEPQKLRDFENSSPKLLINIILGIIFGGVSALFALIYSELTDKKLTYSMLGNNILYNCENDIADLQTYLLTNENKRLGFIIMSNITHDISEKFKNYKNIMPIKAEITSDFVQNIKNIDEAVILAEINKTDSKLYKQIKNILKNMNKDITKEILTRSV